MSPGGKKKSFPGALSLHDEGLPFGSHSSHLPPWLSSPAPAVQGARSFPEPCPPSQHPSVCVHAAAPASGLTGLARSPLLRSCFFLLKDKRRQLLQSFRNSGLLWVSSIHLMGSVSLGCLHKSGANELKETGLISELPPSPLPPRSPCSSTSRML